MERKKRGTNKHGCLKEAIQEKSVSWEGRDYPENQPRDQ